MTKSLEQSTHCQNVASFGMTSLWHSLLKTMSNLVKLISWEETSSCAWQIVYSETMIILTTKLGWDLTNVLNWLINWWVEGQCELGTSSAMRCRSSFGHNFFKKSCKFLAQIASTSTAAFSNPYSGLLSWFWQCNDIWYPNVLEGLWHADWRIPKWTLPLRL